MKNLYGWIAFIIAVSLLLMPLIGTHSEKSTPIISTSFVKEASNTDTFKLNDTENGKIYEITVKDYIFGVVAAEMPALYHEEALKAQALAAYTFALYRSAENQSKDYDITTSSETDQAFISRKSAREKWGENADEYEAKIDAAIASVENKVITYNGKIILSVYTAISGGKTESAENVWGKSVPYLCSVESIGDILCPDYLSSASFSKDEIKALLCTPNGITAEYTEWFSSPELSQSGTVLSMNFGNITLSGADIRNALGLRSADFDVSYSDETFYFSVRGYGHLCGMSQYGANYMAMQGSNCEEIIKWYYNGCNISDI